MQKDGSWTQKILGLIGSNTSKILRFDKKTRENKKEKIRVIDG